MRKPVCIARWGGEDNSGLQGGAIGGGDWRRDDGVMHVHGA